MSYIVVKPLARGVVIIMDESCQYLVDHRTTDCTTLGGMVNLREWLPHGRFNLIEPSFKGPSSWSCSLYSTFHNQPLNIVSLEIWPKYLKIRWRMIVERRISISSSLRMDTFVLLAVNGTLNIRRQHHISKASILLRSFAFIVHDSAP